MLPLLVATAVVLLLFVPVPPATAETPAGVTYLSNRPWTQVSNGWGPLEADRSNGEHFPADGERLTLAGVGYDKGLGVHARSEVQVTLDRACSRFLSSVGVDDEVGSNGSVIFKVYADNTKIFDSGVLRGSSPTRNVDLDVRGVTGLRLVVTDGGDGIGWDHADWADARLACSPPPAASASLTDRPWTQVANGWGPLEADRSNGEHFPADGERLTLAGVGYDKGLGVHARSEVQVTLDRACSRFLSSVGVDDEVGSNGSVIFKVYADNTKIFDSGVLRGSSPTRNVDLDVRGVTGLRLVVTDGGDGIGWDHADWADARLACATAAPVTPATASQVDSEHSGATATPMLRGANERWARTFPGGDVRMPLVVGDRVFVTAGYVVDPVDHRGKAVRLVALDRRSGVELWSAWLHDDLANDTDFAFATYGDGKVFAATTGGRLSAFHAVTGQNLWTAQLRDLRVSSAPTAFDGHVYVYGYENSLGRVWSVSQLDGRADWEFASQWLGGHESPPSVVADAVFVTGGCDQTYALRRTDGQVLWDTAGRCYGGSGATPVHHLGRLYSLSDSWQGGVLARDARTGAEVGRFPSVYQAVTRSSTGYFGDGLKIEAYDLPTRRLLWRFSSQTRLLSQPLLVNGVVYVAAESNEVWGIDASTGALISKRPLGGLPSTRFDTMNAGEGMLLVPAGNRLVAFG